jgi:DnaJ like chaperone protein
MAIWRRLSDMAAAIGDSGAGLMERVFGTGKPPSGEQTVAFTMAVIALGAKMAKADGVVVGVEVAAFNRVFRFEAAQAENVAHLFALAAADVAGYETYADKIAGLLAGKPQLLADVLDCLFHIATADRLMHPGEDRFLETVSQRFGISPSTFRHIRAHFVADASSPYDVLGLDPSVSDADLKARHRKLVRENHPDLMVGRGVPPELVALADRKLAAINSAYSSIARERGL